MENSPFISVQGLHLSFPLHLDNTRSFRVTAAKALGISQHEKRVYKAALSNINLRIKPGDRVALIGSNGSGKTSLLRVLNGVYEPVQGKVIRKGRVASLINATMGMDLYVSGMENIYLRGQHVGLTRKEIEPSVDGIIEFAELADDIYRPVRTYSSGMLARLAFAIATSTKADIYLMDEWIGAGDARFFERAQKRIAELFNEQTILVLASHSDALVKKWCDKALVLEKGHQYTYTDVTTGLDIKNRLMRGETVRVPTRS